MRDRLPPELLEQLGLDPEVPEPPVDGPDELPAPELSATGPYEQPHPIDVERAGRHAPSASGEGADGRSADCGPGEPT